MNANDIIDSLGGTKSVAKLCGVTDGAVSQWRDNGLPPPRMQYLVLYMFLRDRHPRVLANFHRSSDERRTFPV